MHRVPTLPPELALLFAAIRLAVTMGGLGWLLYIAFEPQLRRRSPRSLISWSRLVGGRLRDSMVGGHLLAGITLGVVAVFAMTSFSGAPLLAIFPPLLPWSSGDLLSLWCYLPVDTIAGGLGCSLIMDLISMPVRRRWLAAVLFVVVMTLILMPSYGPISLLTTVRLVVLQTVVAFALVRFGLLATVASLYTVFVIQEFPLTTNWSAWYAPAALLGIATLITLALYGFVTTLRGRLLWPAKLDAS